MLSAISDAGATFWMMPFAVSSGGYFTGYAIANPNNLAAEVQVEIVNTNGMVREQTTIEVPALTRTANVVPSGLPRGYLRFRSNFLIHMMGAVGTEDLRQLDVVPP